MTEKQRIIMYNNISSHGEDLRIIFSFSPQSDMVSICKKLFSLEYKGNKIMVDFCNGLIDSNTIDYATEKIFNTLLFILHLSHSSPLAKSIIINRDPRGYCLKIASSYIHANNLKIYRDFGGYGIIAPDFRIYKP
jgi:hypothetical protein